MIHGIFFESEICVRADYHDIEYFKEMHNWLKKNVKKNNYDYKKYMHPKFVEVFFRRTEDAMLFTLRWA